MSRTKKVKKENDYRYRILSSNIRYHRERSGMTIDELADASGISPSYLSALESPTITHNPSLEVLFDLSKKMNIEPYLLFIDLQKAGAAYADEIALMVHLTALSRRPRLPKIWEYFPEIRHDDMVAESAADFNSGNFDDMSLKEISALTRKDPTAFLTICLVNYLKTISEDDDQDCVVTV